MRVWKMALIFSTVFSITYLTLSDGFCADVAKIGTVSFQKILENSIAGKAAKKEITEEGQRMEADLKKNGDEVKVMQEQLEKDAAVMSKEAREEKKWQLDRKMDDFKALKVKYDRKIQEIQMRLVNKVRKEVLEIINAYGKKSGYLLIVEDITALYAPETLDITDQIIQIYNEKQSKAK
jgi:outer membrane protein